MVKEQKKEKVDKTVESIFTDSQSLQKAKEIIQSLNQDKRRELRAILNSSLRTDLKNRISQSDVKKLLEMLEDVEKSKGLFKVDELRPTAWSKTVTFFDVYETDEENFEPYISPLATVGTVRTTSSTSDTSIGEAGTGIENPEEVPGTTETSQESEEPSIWNTLSFGLIQ